MRILPMVAVSVALASTSAFAQVNAADTDAEAAIMAYVQAVMAGDPDRLLALLAPEFQIQRENGVGQERAAYVAGARPAITQFLGLSDLYATSFGDIMVARYVLHLGATVEGRAMEALAPRLTVFRREGDVWLVVAHANFARLQ